MYNACCIMFSNTLAVFLAKCSLQETLTDTNYQLPPSKQMNHQIIFTVIRKIIHNFIIESSTKLFWYPSYLEYVDVHVSVVICGFVISAIYNSQLYVIHASGCSKRYSFVLLILHSQTIIAISLVDKEVKREEYKTNYICVFELDILPV